MSANATSPTKSITQSGPPDFITDVTLKGNENFNTVAILFALSKNLPQQKTHIFQISIIFIMWLLHLTTFCIHHTVTTN
jgi:hypothetical protein